MWAIILLIMTSTQLDNVLPVRAVAAEDEDLPSAAAAMVAGEGIRKALQQCRQAMTAANETRTMVEVVCIVVFVPVLFGNE